MTNGTPLPLVLLHGFAGGSWSYDAVLRYLTARCGTVQVPRIAFHGAGPIPSIQPPNFLDEVERIASSIAESVSEPVVLAGYSMGGRLALGVAIHHPELVRRLVLLSSRRGLDSDVERLQRRNADERWAQLLEREGLDRFLEAWWEQPLFCTQTQLPSPLLLSERARRRELDAAALAMAMRRLGLGAQPSYASEVTRLALPVTLVAGRLDEKFLALSHRLCSELPQCRCVVVDGAGHNLLLEAPERVARIIWEECEQ